MQLNPITSNLSKSASRLLFMRVKVGINRYFQPLNRPVLPFRDNPIPKDR